jgi:hypothetical protein
MLGAYGVMPLACIPNRESKSSGGVPEEAKGKNDSSKTTCRETNRRFVLRSRHRHPLCSEEYPRKTQARGDLVGSSGRGVRVAGAPEDPKVGIGGSVPKRAK